MIKKSIKNIVIIALIILVFIIVFLPNLLKKTKKEDKTQDTNQPIVEEIEKTWKDEINKDAVISIGSILGFNNIIEQNNRITNELKKNSKINMELFIKKWEEEYSKLNINERTTKDIDFISAFIDINDQFNHINLFDYKDFEILNMWSFGYDQEGNLINNIDSSGFIMKVKSLGTERIVILRGTSTYYLSFKAYINKVEDFNKWYGVLNENGGVLNGSGIKSTYSKDGILKYQKEDVEYYKNILNDNKSFFDFIYDYYQIDHEQRIIMDAEIKAEMERMKKPRIGMTQDEVRKTDWGYPNDINRDTYSWGVKEQWVYDRHGYVYFTDGIVTSVSER